MKKPIQISIPSPCHENWDAMTPVDKGRFCASCQKTVFDFTKLSDREIASVLKNNNNACGRFRATQLDRDLIVPKEKSTIWMAASAAVVSFLTIGNHTISAQTPVNTEQHVSETDDIKVGKVAATTIKIIRGIVLDSSGYPVPAANIYNINSKAKAQSNFNGIFSIEGKINDSLNITFLGMIPQKIKVESNDTLKIILQDDLEVLQDVYVGYVSVKKPTYKKDNQIYSDEKKRTFVGRVFHSIGNIFR